ncbi:methyl-accepting chemotaxis protein [Castellaniella sp.]|uniref:methyl-accepting chemotaxis protein n=1 Tax=Castellaniella sp. TaxID=1955812 RepID=UPI002AFE0BD3|nr:methyl-accepting chemotaxis protein [Castellaniella sp.]
MLSLLVLGALQHLTQSIDHLKSIESKRYQATQFATEYKNLIQAMSRDVMAFVSSEQPEFQENYQHLTNILHGRAPDQNGVQRPMLDRFRQLDFTAEEMARLESAHAQLVELGKTEVNAINTASGQLDDGQGGIKVALPNALLAKVMIFGQQYAQASADIAQAIDDFDTMQAGRYAQSVEQASRDNRHAHILAIAAITALLACSMLALWQLYCAIKRPLNEGVRLAQRLAQGDLTAHTTVLRSDELGELLLALNGIGQGLHRTVEDVRDHAGHIAQVSHQISDGNLRLANSSNEQASKLQQAAASMEELAATVAQNAANAERSKTLAAEAVAAARTGGNTVGHAVATMREVRQGSRKITDITDLINTIAFQTNILALNAAVEAARAGTHGKGFAVVAAEVRSLAQRSADAAKDIEQLIKHSVAQLDHGASLVDEAGSSIHAIIQSVNQVQTMVNEIADASLEQANGINQVSQAVSHLDVITQQNLSLVQQATQATALQQTQSRALVATLSRFTLNEPAGDSTAPPYPDTTTQIIAAPRPAIAGTGELALAWS